MNLMSNLLLVPLDDTVVFPNMNVTLTGRRGRRGARAARARATRASSPKVGTVAEVAEHVRLPGGARAVDADGPASRAWSAPPTTGLDGSCASRSRSDPTTSRSTAAPASSSASTAPSSRRSSSCAATTGASRRSCARSPSPARWPTPAGYSPDLTFEQKVELLETLDVTERLELALRLQRERLAELQVRKRIRDDVESGAEQQQREYFLRKQMESIRKELGEDDASVVDEYRTKIEEAGMPEAVREQAERELGRLERMGEQSGEVSMIRTYLDWLIAVPWGKRSEERLDPVARARGARRRPRRPRGRQGPHRRVPRRAQAARGARDRGRQAVGRDPDADRAARHRQDLDRRVDRAGDWAASSSACRSAACATRPRSAATGAPTSARCRAAWCAPCATPGR